MQDRKLHVCIVTAAFPSLTETFVTTKALELQKRGHKVTVIKNEIAGQVNTSHVAQVKKSGIEVLTLKDFSSVAGFVKSFFAHPFLLLQSLSLKPTIFKERYTACMQLALLQKSAFDVVHFEFSGLAISYNNSIKKLTSKTVVSCRGTAEKVKLLSQPQRRSQMVKLFEAVDAVHCVSADMVDTITSCCPPQKIFTNRPSVDTEIFKRKQPYKQLHLKIHILSVGRLTFQKGYLLGLLAMKELKNNGLRFTWTIAGEGPQHEELCYHIHALGLSDHVVLAGKKNRNEIIELYNTADIFFLPSVYEGIANVSLEAMAMELPVVATRSGGMAEVIAHGEDGLLADVYDYHNMALQLLTISYDYEKRKKIGLNARKKILQQFTLQRQANEFEQQYYHLVYNLSPHKTQPQQTAQLP